MILFCFINYFVYLCHMKEKILEIYTDASGDNKNGIGILFINPDETERQFSYKVNNQIFYNLIKNKHRTNLKLDSIQLEILAIYVAIKELQVYSRTFDKIILYSDNLISIDHLNNKKNKKNNNKSRNSVLEMVKIIKNMLIEFNIDVEFRWIKSHCGVYGNELADRLARVGARNKVFYNNEFLNNIQRLLFETKKVVWRKTKNEEFETVYLKLV